MRTTIFLPALLLPFALSAQNGAGRFIEVQVSDTVRLPFEGMDLEVRMDDPTQLAMTTASESGDTDADYLKLLEKAVGEAAINESQFIALMKANGFTYRLSSTEHAQDYTGQTNKTFEVNTYLVELKAADIDRYTKATESHSNWSGPPKVIHYGDPVSASPRLMRKLFDNAKRRGEALVAVTGGRLGRIISAQELPRSEGSVLEQLFKLDKGVGREEMLMELGSSAASTMAFRFELLD